MDSETYLVKLKEVENLRKTSSTSKKEIEVLENELEESWLLFSKEERKKLLEEIIKGTYKSA